MIINNFSENPQEMEAATLQKYDVKIEIFNLLSNEIISIEDSLWLEGYRSVWLDVSQGG